MHRINPGNSLLVFCLLFSAINVQLHSQVKYTEHNKNSDFNRYEINVGINYCKPVLESYGGDISIDEPNSVITIGGKRLINSDNFGTTSGYGIQVFGNMSLFKSDYIKVVGSIGYNQLSSKYSLPDGFTYGVRMYLFSIGTGLQINPVGIHKFYPSVFGLFRFNEIGGETYFHAGLDFFIASPRFGVSSGINLNYKFNKKVGIFIGASYNYDNLLNKQAEGTTFNDPHVINFIDKQSSTNGLIQDRRIAYVNISTGINIYFK